MRRLLMTYFAVATIALLTLGGTAQAAEVVYEGGDYTAGENLNGKDGGIGFDSAGSWGSNIRNGVVRSGSLTWGNLLIAGNSIRSNAWSAPYRSLGTDLDDANLLDDGSTLWFSYVQDIAGQNMTNLDYSFALTTAPFDNNYGTKQNLEGDDQIGIGVSNWRYKVYGASWQDEGDVDGNSERTHVETGLELNATDMSRILMVGKIEWGADALAAEKLTLYTPGTDLALGTPILDAWETAAIDQSLLNTVAIQWKDSNAAMDEIRFGASYADVTPVITDLVWDNGSTDLTWETATNWDPDVTPTVATACTIDNGDTVTLATTGEAISLDIGATTAGTTLNVSGALTVTPLPTTVGSNGTLNVTGTLTALELNSSGTVTIGPAADVTGVGSINVNGGTFTAGGALAVSSLTYNAGTLALGGNDLTAGSLTANANLDISGSTVAASSALTVNNATLTLGNDIATSNFTLDGGAVAGGKVTASGNYYFTNVADYTDAITGGRLNIGISRTSDALVKTSSVDNAYSWTSIYRGVLEVNADAANLGTDRLRFEGADDNTNGRLAVLQTSGTFSRMIGNGGGKVYWNNHGGFAASDAPLTVTLIRSDEAEQPLDWGNNNNGFNNRKLHLGSPYANSVVTLTNDIDGGGGNREIYAYGNPNSDADYAVISGALTNFNNLYVKGQNTFPGMLQVGDVTANKVHVQSGATLSSNGTFTGMLQVANTGRIAPGNSVGTLTVTSDVLMQNGSIYEWEVGFEETDTIQIDSGTLNMDNFVLKILDAEGYVADETVQLPVFTYTVGTTIDMDGFNNDVDNFDTSELNETWTVGTLALTDNGLGLIYLTGLSGGTYPGLQYDINGDDAVNDLDLQLLLSSFGDPYTQEDLDALLLEFGNVVPTGTSEVPEPASMVLLLFGALGLLGLRRRK